MRRVRRHLILFSTWVLTSLSIVTLGFAPGTRAEAAPPLTINISAGQDRGRFGDIAASLLLAEQLQRIQAADEIRLIIENPKAYEKLKILIPSLRFTNPRDDRLKNGQFHHKGVAIYLFPKPPPAADYAFYFSTDHLNVRKKGLNIDEFPLHRSAPRTFLFQEPSGQNNLDEGFLQRVPPVGAKHLELATGPLVRRLYIDQEKPPIPAREAVLRQLRQEFEGSWRIDPVPSFRSERVQAGLETWLQDPNVLIALSYAQSDTLRKTYRQALVRLLSRKEYQGQKLLLIKNVPKPQPSEMDPKLEFEPLTGWSLERVHNPDGTSVEIAELSYCQMSFELSQNLMAVSDLPPLVTGDVSAALAINYEKPHFYEIMPWKTGSTFALFWSLLAKSVRNWLDAPTAFQLNFMQESYPFLRSADGNFLVPSHLDPNPSGLSFISRRWERIMAHPQFLKRVSEGMAKLRKDSSLAERIKRFVRRSPDDLVDCRSLL